jgi:hypothetical protein
MNIIKLDKLKKIKENISIMIHNHEVGGSSPPLATVKHNQKSVNE